MKGKNDMSKTENKDALLQTAFNNAQTVFQSQVGIFRTADKNIQNVRNVLILTLYTLCKKEKEIKGVSTDEEFKLNPLYVKCCELLGIKKKLMNSPSNANLKKVLYVVIKATIINLISEDEDNSLIDDVFSFTDLKEDETKIGYRVVAVEKSPTSDDQLIYELSQDEMTVAYNYLKPSFKIRDEESTKENPTYTDHPNRDATQVRLTNEKITSIYGKLFNDGEENESEYESEDDDLIEIIKSFETFISTKFKGSKGKQNLTIFYDESNLKALTNIQTHIVNVMQNYHKLYKEDEIQVDLKKTGT